MSRDDVCRSLVHEVTQDGRRLQRLLSDALEAGDADLEALCKRALAGDEHAILCCAGRLADDLAAWDGRAMTGGETP